MTPEELIRFRQQQQNPDVRGQNFAPGTGNPGPIQNAYSPVGGEGFGALNPQMNPGVPDSSGMGMPGGIKPIFGNTGVVGPPMPTSEQLNPTGGIKAPGTYQPSVSGSGPGIPDKPTLAGSLGAPPSTMGGLSTPQRTPGMPRPRPTRNFGSRLGTNRGVI